LHLHQSSYDAIDVFLKIYCRVPPGLSPGQVETER
jgi:hypothetical protein